MTRKIELPAYRIPLFMAAEAIMLLVLTGCGAGSSTLTIPVGTNLPVASTVQNTVPVTVGANLASTPGPNAIFTSVTVCTPGVYPVGQNPISGPPTPGCQTIPNVLVDTGSVGLRLLDNPAFQLYRLPLVTDSNNHPLFECVQFADFSYAWGPVLRATVQMAGETAAQVPPPSVLSSATYGPETPNTGIPIQAIASPTDLSTGFQNGDVSVPAVPSDCLSSPPSGGLPMAVNTAQTLGANGILGVGTFLEDCGATCTSTRYTPQYYYCPAGTCSAASVALDMQVWNPVAAFAYDNNGLLLALPNFPPTNGSSTLTGSLIFGVDTQSDNALSTTALIYTVDAYGNFPQVTLSFTPNDNSYPSNFPALSVSYLSPQNGSYIDSGSPAFYFSDSNSLNSTYMPDCQDRPGLYCPAIPENPSVTVYGANQTHTLEVLSVVNADSLLNSGTNYVFSNLGGDSGIDAATDYVDLGLPFFFGRSVFVGFAGTALLNLQQQAVNYSNGYWSF